MIQRLAGKTVLITAAGQGIGLATAERFAAEGARVIATDIRTDSLEGKPFEVRTLDVLDTAAVNELAKELGAVDALFNCAGFVHAGSILETSEEDWDFAFNLNAKAMFRTIRAFLPAMLDSGGGSIINMSSAASSVKWRAGTRFGVWCVEGGRDRAETGQSAIAADGLTRGIRCNAICPGTVDSPSLQQRIAEQAAAQGAMRRAGARGVRRAPADGAGRQAGGNRGAGAVSRVG